MKTKTFLLFWKTKSSRYQIIRGASIEEAFNTSGYGLGAMGALDYYQDITKFVESKSIANLLHDMQRFKDKGYFWKRETVAKVRKIFRIEGDQPFQEVEDAGQKGVTLTVLGEFLYDNLFREEL